MNWRKYSSYMLHVFSIYLLALKKIQDHWGVNIFKRDFLFSFDIKEKHLWETCSILFFLWIYGELFKKLNCGFFTLRNSSMLAMWNVCWYTYYIYIVHAQEWFIPLDICSVMHVRIYKGRQSAGGKTFFIFSYWSLKKSN